MAVIGAGEAGLLEALVEARQGVAEALAVIAHVVQSRSVDRQQCRQRVGLVERLVGGPVGHRPGAAAAQPVGAAVGRLAGPVDQRLQPLPRGPGQGAQLKFGHHQPGAVVGSSQQVDQQAAVGHGMTVADAIAEVFQGGEQGLHAMMAMVEGQQRQVLDGGVDRP